MFKVGDRVVANGFKFQPEADVFWSNPSNKRLVEEKLVCTNEDGELRRIVTRAAYIQTDGRDRIKISE